MVNVEKLSENKVLLTVSVSAEQFDAALDKAFEEVVKDVKVDGFRPGKMPKSMFIKRFGYEALYNEGVNQAINATFYEALAEAKVYPIQQAEPKVDLVKDTKIEKGSGFEYTIEVDVWPEVHLGQYVGINVKPLSTRVLKKDVDEYVEQQLKNKTENVIKEAPAELGDTVILDFEGFVDGTPFEGGKAENYELVLGSNSFVPGFEDQLVGTKAEESKDVVVTFPKDYHASLASKEATFKCTVHEVKTKVTPKLDEEFVSLLDIKDVTTVEQYLAYAKEQVKARKVKESEQQFETDCINTVVESSYAEFPESLISYYVARDVKRVEDQAAQYKLPVDVLLGYMGVNDLDTFRKNAEEQTRKGLLTELVFDEIIKRENIEATAEEVEAQYLEMASGDASKVEGLKKQYPYQVEYQVKYLKAVKLIKDKAVTK